jgi:hypothetical protein
MIFHLAMDRGKQIIKNYLCRESNKHKETKERNSRETHAEKASKKITSWKQIHMRFYYYSAVVLQHET